jgi:hypothetical protein
MSPQNPTPQQGANLIETELQHNIPVQPHAPNDNNPIAGANQFVEHDSKHDDGLEQVLNDVSASVKEADKKTSKKSLFSFLKKNKVKVEKPAEPLPSQAPAMNNTTRQEKIPENPQEQIAKKEEKTKVPKPILAAVVAIFIATGLSAAAFHTFNQTKDGSNKLQAAKTTNVQPQTASQSTQLTVNDINDFSSTLDSNFNSLNDAQDFNESDISDANLGL